MWTIEHSSLLTVIDEKRSFTAFVTAGSWVTEQLTVKITNVLAVIFVYSLALEIYNTVVLDFGYIRYRECFYSDCCRIDFIILL